MGERRVLELWLCPECGDHSHFDRWKPEPPACLSHIPPVRMVRVRALVLDDAADAEYRACWLDQGDREPDVSVWTTDRDEAMEIARRVAAMADPQYDEVWLERRVCSLAERVVLILSGASDG